MLAILGFDASSVPLIERLLGEGRLPALAELRARGQYSPIETPATHFATGTYHTLYTGLDIGEHGLHYPFQWSATDQRVRLIYDFPRPDSLWERLARAGRRQLVIDPYESLPPREMSGIFISGWQFKNRVALPAWAIPRSAYRNLARQFSRSPLVEEVFGPPSVNELVRMYRHLAAAPQRLAEGAIQLIAAQSFDLIHLNFSASHIAGHQLWDLSQLPEEDLDDSTRETLGHGLESVYEAVDGAIGRLVKALPEDADIIVASPTGMGENTSRCDWLPGMLEAIMSSRRSGPSDGGTKAGSSVAAGSFVWGLRAHVPTGLRAAVTRAIPDRWALELTARFENPRLKWRETRAFMAPCDHHGHIRLNIRGREREGIVDPTEVDELKRRIADGLASFRDPDGAPSVAAVDDVADLVGDQPRAEWLPDLIVRWAERPTTRLTTLSSSQFGDVRRRGTTGRSGTHTADAWAIVAPGASRPRALGRAPRVADIPVTACAVLGAGTDGMSGESLLDPA